MRGGGEAIISQAVPSDPEAREALGSRHGVEESASLRGHVAPVRFARLSATPDDAAGIEAASL